MLFTNLAVALKRKSFPVLIDTLVIARMICMLGRAAHRFEASLKVVLRDSDTHLLHRFIIISIWLLEGSNMFFCCCCA